MKFRNSHRKSQTATEYIIIVAVVIVIALVVVQIMGGFPGIGSGTSKKVTDYKLSSSNQIGIDKYYFSNNSVLATVKNNNFETLTVNNLTIAGVICNSNNTNISTNPAISFPLTLNPGQSMTINCSSSNFTTSLNSQSTPSVSTTYTNPTTGASYTVFSSGNNVVSNPASGNNSNSSSNIPTNGLVSYWPFDGNTEDNFGTNNGTMGIIFPRNGIKDINNTAYHFASVSGANVNMRNTSSLNITGAMTLMAWVKLDYSQQNKGIATKFYAGGSQRGYGIFTDSDAVSTKLYFTYQRTAGVYTADDKVTTSSNVGSNVWVHVAGVFIPSTSATIYINGIANATDTTNIQSAIASNTANFYVGQSQDGNGFDGTIDEIRIYNRNLSAEEILTIYNIEKP